MRIRDRLPGIVRRAGRPAVNWYRRTWSPAALDLGHLRRTTPVDPTFGAGRGQPLDRVYIQRFLERHATDIRGRALEVKSDRYLSTFGGAVETIDILDIDTGNSRATIVADLQQAPEISDYSFDCFVLTQVLQLVYDLPAAMETAHRILAPNGVLLATVPGITRLSPHENEPELWRLTALSARRLTEDAFGPGAVR